MKRTSFNVLVDALAFAMFAFLTSTGFLMRYQLPPGSGGREVVGVWHGAAGKPIGLLWGYTRHEWGDIHYWVAIGLMGVLALHLLLHWKWIFHVMSHRPNRETSGFRFACGLFGLTSVVVLACAPLVSSTEQVTATQLKAANEDLAPADKSASQALEEADEESGIRGSMTLGEIAELSGVPVDYIVKELNLPTDVATTSRAGRLLRSHGMEMQDLRNVLSNYELSP